MVFELQVNFIQTPFAFSRLDCKFTIVQFFCRNNLLSFSAPGLGINIPDKFTKIYLHVL